MESEKRGGGEFSARRKRRRGGAEKRTIERRSEGFERFERDEGREEKKRCSFPAVSCRVGGDVNLTLHLTDRCNPAFLVLSILEDFA